MKLLLLVTFLAGAYAEAEPEADPYLLYGGYAGHYGYGYAGHYGLPYAYGAYGYPYAAAALKPCTNNAGVAVPCAHGYHGGLVGYGYGWPYVLPAAAAAAPAEDAPAVEEARKKRDADADPAVLATYSHVKTITPLIHNAPAHPVVATYGLHHGYGLGLGYHGLGYGYGLHGKKKREAEAEAEADPYLLYGGLYGYGYAGYGYAGYPYGYAYHPHTYAAGCRNYLGALVPCAGK